MTKFARYPGAEPRELYFFVDEYTVAAYWSKYRDITSTNKKLWHKLNPRTQNEIRTVCLDTLIGEAQDLIVENIQLTFNDDPETEE